MKAEYTEQQKALALRYVVEKFSDDMEPEETALLMEVYLGGLINALPTDSEWVSVEDRLPEVDEVVLVYHPFNGCSTMYASHMSNYKSITHWMPIIPPTK